MKAPRPESDKDEQIAALKQEVAAFRARLDKKDADTKKRDLDFEARLRKLEAETGGGRDQ